MTVFGPQEDGAAVAGKLDVIFRRKLVELLALVYGSVRCRQETQSTDARPDRHTGPNELVAVSLV